MGFNGGIYGLEVMMNGMHVVHYHNSVSGLVADGKYKPNTAIRTEQLTQKYTIQNDIGRYALWYKKECWMRTFNTL